jgi:hypothetical protein
MPTDPSPELKFEIGHVLFIDVVGYSKLLINEQSEQLQKLKEIVRGAEQFRLAEAEGKLLRLPTGDGGALVFRTNPEAPVLCAMEISKTLKNHPELHVRMGIHSGPPGTFFSPRVADDLEQYPQWRSRLRDLGECEVKHGVRVGIVNFCGTRSAIRKSPRRYKVSNNSVPECAGLQSELHCCCLPES